MLVVRQSYRRELSLPGGGVRETETAVDAACRELAEELGLVVPPAELEHVLQRTGVWDWRTDTVDFFELRIGAEPRLDPDRREIVEASFVELRSLVLPSGSRTVPVLTGPARAYVEWKTARSTE